MGFIKSKLKKSDSPEAKSDKPQSLSVAYATRRQAQKIKPKASESGEVHPAELMEDDERAASISDAIMRKRRAKKMAEGGEVEDDGRVDLEANDEEGPSSLDELNAMSVRQSVSSAPMLKENYEKEDMISKIRKNLKQRKGF